THSLWRWVVNYLSVNNVYRQMSDIAKAGPEQLDRVAQSVVMETFRLNQAELLLRDIADDIVFEGFLFPKGSKLRVCIWEGHKDPVLFHNPFQFRPSALTLLGKENLRT